MSHTLHRIGNPESLKKDWVVFAMSAKGVNKQGSAEKLRQFLKLALLYHPLNYGDMRTDNSFNLELNEIINNVKDDSIVHVVFSEQQNVCNFLSDLRKKDLGMSVVISGLFQDGKCCIHEAGLTPHTESISLGILGKKELLPSKPILEITTMCGHGLVSPALVRKIVEDLKAGDIAISEAASRLAKPCICGVFNPARASELLLSMTRKE